MADPFATHSGGLDSPAANAAEITPADTDLTTACRALYVGTAGTLKVTTIGGQAVSLTNVSGWVPIRCARVWSTGTTASGIVAVW